MPSHVGRWLALCLWYGSPGPARWASQESETDLSQELPRVDTVPAYRCPVAEPRRTVFATPSTHVHPEEPQVSCGQRHPASGNTYHSAPLHWNGAVCARVTVPFTVYGPRNPVCVGGGVHVPSLGRRPEPRRHPEVRALSAARQVTRRGPLACGGCQVRNVRRERAFSSSCRAPPPLRGARGSGRLATERRSRNTSYLSALP
jgi:hypothetical protein